MKRLEMSAALDYIIRGAAYVLFLLTSNVYSV
jgi:hypothetical protein